MSPWLFTRRKSPFARGPILLSASHIQSPSKGWDKLSAGGQIQQCGWLKDKFGLSWQIVPSALPRLLSDPDREKANRVMQAMLQMEKIEIAKLEQAAAG